MFVLKHRLTFPLQELVLQMLIKTTQLFFQFYCSVLTVAYFVLQHDGKMPQNYKEKKIFKTLLESGTVFLSLFIDICFLS